MNNISVIGLDLARNVFQVHAVRKDAEAICEAVNSRNPSRPWRTAEDKALHTENVCEWRHGVSGTSSQKSASAIQN